MLGNVIVEELLLARPVAHGRNYSGIIPYFAEWGWDGTGQGDVSLQIMTIVSQFYRAKITLPRALQPEQKAKVEDRGWLR